MFNKVDILEAIANKTVPNKMRSAARGSMLVDVDLRGAKDVLSYECPLSGKSPSTGSSESWVVVEKCGHMFHRPSFLELKITECPVCGVTIDSEGVIELSPEG